MASLQHKETHFRLGYYQRWALAAGESLVIDLSGEAQGNTRMESASFFDRTLDWVATPAAGATVQVHTSIRPDGISASAVADPHSRHGEFTSKRGTRENARLAALKFTASGAGAVVEWWSPNPVEVIE